MSEVKWKILAVISSALCLTLIFVVACGFYLARLTPNDHLNLYYIMWKSGLREYDWSTVSRGMFHDQNFRQSINGVTIDEFEEMFPNTFFEKQDKATNARESSHVIYARDYHHYKNNDEFDGCGWRAVFNAGELVNLAWDKGI